MTHPNTPPTRTFTEQVVVDETTGETITITAPSLAELDARVEALLGEPDAEEPNDPPSTTRH